MAHARLHTIRHRVVSLLHATPGGTAGQCVLPRQEFVPEVVETPSEWARPFILRCPWNLRATCYMSDFRQQLIPRRKRERLVGMWFLDLEPAQRSLIGHCRHPLNRSGVPFGSKPIDFSVGVRPRAARTEKHLR